MNLIQWFLILVLFAGLVGLWIRALRPPKEDPRLSKGLQLLQSKIAILEDLSDRTDTQVQQLSLLLEKKGKEIQEKVAQSESLVVKIEQKLQQVREISKIFQDHIPHHEIIERKKTITYVKAARLAHQGASVAQICQELDITPAEADFILNVNKEQLMFCEESLPDWAKEEENSTTTPTPVKATEAQFEMPATLEENPKQWIQKAIQETQNQKKSKSSQEALKKIGEQFQTLSQTTNAASSLTQPVATTEETKPTLPEKTIGVRPYEFRKIDMNKNLS